MRSPSNGSIGCMYRKPNEKLRCLHRAESSLVCRALAARKRLAAERRTLRVEYFATLGAAPGATGPQAFGQQLRSGLRQLLSVREDALGVLGCHLHMPVRP